MSTSDRQSIANPRSAVAAASPRTWTSWPLPNAALIGRCSTASAAAGWFTRYGFLRPRPSPSLSARFPPPAWTATDAAASRALPDAGIVPGVGSDVP